MLTGLLPEIWGSFQHGLEGHSQFKKWLCHFQHGRWSTKMAGYIPPVPKWTCHFTSPSLILCSLSDLLCPREGGRSDAMWLSDLFLRRLCSFHICPFESQPPYKGQARLLKDERPWTEKEGDHPERNPSPSVDSQRHGPRHVGEVILDFPAPRKWPQHRKKRETTPSQPTQLKPLTSEHRGVDLLSPPESVTHGILTNKTLVKSTKFGVLRYIEIDDSSVNYGQIHWDHLPHHAGEE